MPNNWAEWDAAHGHGEGRTRSADKLAQSIKGALGHTGSPAVPAHGSRGSVVHQTTKKDLKRPAPVKGEKDRADSMRTQIRMAAYQRNKAAATGQDPVNKTTPKVEQKVNPHEPKPSSAQKLVADRDQRYETARHEAYQATRAADSGQADPAKDRAAAEAHRRAADLAPDDQKQRAHDAQARIHRQQAKQVESARADTLAQHDRLANISDRAEGASARAERENTKENHQAASDLHQQAADLARSMGETQMAQHHQNLAGMHQMVAEGPRKRTGKAGDRSMEKGTSARSADKLAAQAKTPKTSALTGQNVHKSLEGAGLKRRAQAPRGEYTNARGQAMQRPGYSAQPGQYEVSKNGDGSYRVDVHGDRTTERGAARHDADTAKAKSALEDRGWSVHPGSTGMRGHLEVSAPKAPAAPEAAKQSRYEKIAADAERLSAQSEADLDNGPHRDAAEAHRAAAAATSDPAAKAGHEAAAKTMDRRAKSAETLARTRGIAEAKKAAPPPRAPGQSTGDRYRQLHQVRLDSAAGIRNSIDNGTGEIDYLRHSTIASKAEAEQNKLWPKLTSRDIAESVMQKSPGVDPHLHEMLTAELAKHIEFTGRNHSWKGITLDVAKIPPKGNGQRVGAHTVGGNHIVLNSDFLYRPGGSPVPNFNGFREHFHSAGPMGKDEYADTRHILAHEIGHTQHYAITRVTLSRGDQEAHDLLGPHVHSATSRYGATNTHEKAAEAYTASFARAHGHQEYMKAAADAGDHLVRQVKQKRGNF